MFSTISKIIPEQAETWSGRVFLTLDIDWAHDGVLLDAIEIVERAGASATWFVTHDTPLLARLRANPAFELGIHPNFNFLLNGDSRNGRNATEVVGRLMDLVPDATAVRSHSMTQSSVLLDVFRQFGLTHDSNQFIPANVGIPLRPWTHWNQLIRIPYCWEDDVACLLDNISSPPLSEIARQDGLKVIDFHPIHIFLNTETLSRYVSGPGRL